MKKKFLLFLLLLFFIPIFNVKAMDVNYEAHVQNIGWMNEVSNGEMCGTTGRALQVEALKISLKNNEFSGSIKYQTHVENMGWLPWVKDGELAGTTGRALQVEAIKINLEGEIADHYSVFYRTHVENMGWLPWVKDGELAGTTGRALQVEAFEIKIISKDNLDAHITYSIHNKEGWQNEISDGEMAGTTGKAMKLDLIKINLQNNTSYNGSIEYQTFLTPTEWGNISTNNQISGYENVTIEAIKIYLTGELEKHFNIYYRVHISNYGWLDWTNNGNVSGSIGYFLPIEAIEIKLQDKNSSDVVVGNRSFLETKNEVNYSSHVENIGWQDYVSDGEESGTTGKSLQIEAFKVKLNTKLAGSISYNSYITKRGWSSYVSNDNISGTTGLARTIEGISIKLNGEISNYYDIYYRTHLSNIGWLSWAKNGEKSGATDSETKIEALQIKLIKKGLSFDEDTSNPYVTGSWKDNKYYDYFGKMATGFKIIDGVKYYFNSEGKMYGKDVQKVIDVSSWQETINWDFIKNNEDVDSAIIRVGWGTSYGGECGLDSYLDRNIKEVQRLGIPYGIYIYAYAETTKAAETEANFVISKMKQYNMPKNTFVWYDAEIGSISRSTYNSVIPAFINKMKSNGYNNVGVYSGVRQLDTTNGNTNTSTIRSYPIWVSQYYKDLQYTGAYKGWQFASDEKVYGISGDVDVSMFKK